jgi:threonylcarbamoyladenosine tRNA methylthiotransferase MtaB
LSKVADIIKGMASKASFGSILQQAVRYYTLRFAGLFNLPIPLRYAFGIGVSTIKVGLTTLGCKVNQYESATLAEDLQQKDYVLVPFNCFADVYIINTCTVTAFSDFQSRQLIRRAHRVNPEAKIIVTGCYAQIAAADIAAIDGVTLVVGNDQKHSIPELLRNCGTKTCRILASDIFQQKEFCTMPLSRFFGRSRAYLKIQDGCNSFCSYCIVPFARGKSRSMPQREVLSAVADLSQKGYKEIVLTGIHLGAYGNDFIPPANLTDMIKQIIDQKLQTRIRLSSIEPGEITDELLHLLNKKDILCPHLHIPLQSGNDKILKLMKRDYDAAFYRKLIEKIAAEVIDVAIGVDVMVGFPSEGEEEFDSSLRLLQEIPIAYLHVFPYSERPQTSAKDIKPKVTESVKKQRASILRSLSTKKREEFTRRFLGKELQVLVEKIKDKKTGLMKGVSHNYLPVLIDKTDSSVLNKIVIVQTQDIRNGELYGKIVHG